MVTVVERALGLPTASAPTGGHWLVAGAAVWDDYVGSAVEVGVDLASSCANEDVKVAPEAGKKVGVRSVSSIWFATARARWARSLEPMEADGTRSKRTTESTEGFQSLKRFHYFVLFSSLSSLGLRSFASQGEYFNQ
ncbi:hypothetical protein MA16_Dca026176 [Dendrobium catenatum]|uniref:Uncharacterized protein n=1 Tax=Dendrobium catenatum TaxID=906689 RepID=A0A2I0V8S1_9ASPA|nr:hypothetical protein MA16_Dca026176 [Dendrobium catenatum]